MRDAGRTGSEFRNRGPGLSPEGSRVTRRAFLSSVAAAWLGWRAAAASGGPRHAEDLFVATINDIHATDAAGTAMLDEAVRAINARPDVALTVVLGDISDGALPEQFEAAKASLDRLKAPYLAVPGNHDVSGVGLRAYAAYRGAFGEGHWVRQEGAWTFIGLDTCEGRAVEPKVRLGMLSWLAEQLRGIPQERPLALFCHHPFNPSVPKGRVRNAEQVLALFTQHRLHLVASGHWHGNLVESHDGVLFTTTACCATSHANHDLTAAKGFRLFQLHGDAVETEFVRLPGDMLGLREKPTASRATDRAQNYASVPESRYFPIDIREGFR